MTEEKKLEVVFAPGCFDSFNGTQEELNELMAEIQSLAASGELFESSTLIDVDDLDDEEYTALQLSMQNIDTRTLQ